MSNAAMEVLDRNILLRLMEGNPGARELEVLDRWAMQQPERLLRMAEKGPDFLLSRLRETASREREALLTPSARKMRQAGMSETEILDSLITG